MFDLDFAGSAVNARFLLQTPPIRGKERREKSRLASAGSPGDFFPARGQDGHIVSLNKSTGWHGAETVSAAFGFTELLRSRVAACAQPAGRLGRVRSNAVWRLRASRGGESSVVPGARRAALDPIGHRVAVNGIDVSAAAAAVLPAGQKRTVANPQPEQRELRLDSGRRRLPALIWRRSRCLQGLLCLSGSSAGVAMRLVQLVPSSMGRKSVLWLRPVGASPRFLSLPARPPLLCSPTPRRPAAPAASRPLSRFSDALSCASLRSSSVFMVRKRSTTKFRKAPMTVSPTRMYMKLNAT
ncbi:hypothetical protein EYF80_035994 [Liparis tanakae]|uniref:Uncharacterized protein n=1 Tax=Liparis tanakae TaxID=230148 RepID=A0A4Z2GKP7_9TELE|nr:hypothetical protein EYF80_035994 [Liparis tanakae]